MLVDIHSHTLPSGKNAVVYNLPIFWEEYFLNDFDEQLFSAGFHPWKLEDFSLQRMLILEKLCENPSFVAIGECGLDKYSSTPLERQIEIFEQQITLSEEKEKALIIHCVGRFNELFSLKKTLRPKQRWIIHGFRGKPQLAEQVLKSGCALSFGEFFNPETVLLTPTENLFLETDESKLSIETIYERIAQLKSLSVDDLSAGRHLLERRG